MARKPQTAPPDAFRSRIVARDVVKASTLTPNPLNWRTHPTMQRDALKNVMAKIGWVADVTVNKQTGHIIDGHLRHELALENDDDVSVTFVDLTEDEERRVLLTLDPLSAMATQDDIALHELLAAVNNDDVITSILKEVGAIDESKQLSSESQLTEFEYAVLVKVDGEKAQASLMKTLQDDGHECQALML